MQCPECGSRAYVYATKPHGETKQRYRECRICGHRFSTWEEIERRALRGYERRAQPSLFANDETQPAPVAENNEDAGA